jgi:hypothetical protein
LSDNNQWYDNKELFEQIQELKDKITYLCIEMQKTTTLIRDYNGLRERINNIEIELGEDQGKEKVSTQVPGYVIGILGILVAIAAVIFK